MKNFDLENIDCHATLVMIEKRWGFPRRTLRGLLGMTKSGQSGRSMIEMLGVLAIIGVLSVGGIAGYSKAMMKYRINKTIEQITLITQNTRTFFAPQRNYSGLGSNDTNGKKVIKKAKLIPDEMWNGNNVENVFGGVVYLASDTDPSGFGLGFDDIPEEACIDILTHNWPDNIIAISLQTSTSPTNMIGVSECINATDEAYEHNAVNALCRKHNDLPVSVDKAIEECAKGDAIVFGVK